MATSNSAANNDGTARDDKIKVVIRTQDGRESSYRMNPTTRLETLFHTFCVNMELEYRSIRFFHNGSRLLPCQFPGELELEEGEDAVEIEAMGQQMGGGLGQYEG